jgi:hypothetical protein
MKSILRLFGDEVEGAMATRRGGSEDTGPMIVPALCNQPGFGNNDFQPVFMRYFLSVHMPGGGGLTLLGGMLTIKAWLNRQLILKI